MTLTPPLVSALTAGILIIMQVALMFGVIMVRRRARQSIGDGGNQELLAAIRRHGNFAENAAIFIAGFTLLELLGVDRTSIALLCAVFVAGRTIHAIGLSLPKTANRYRFAGVALTAVVGLALGARLVLYALPHLLG
jgi:uncharacterized protein